MVGGRWIVRDGAHVTLDVAARAARGARAMSALVVDHIGLLVTNDPALGDGPLGLVRDAALVHRGRPSSPRSSARARRATSASTRPGAA